ncbi:MAG: peptide chain release factor 1 [Dehalococcoidia bacterium]|nr:MAG: peptide chain release factor 1 [Dehalococcoidia bacterium]
MLNRLAKIEKRYQEIDRQMASPEIASDLEQLQRLAQEKANLETVVTKYREYKATDKALVETRAMLSGEPDEEMKALTKQEIDSLEAKLVNLLQELKLALLPKDPNDEKDIIVEIRGGAGGDEAALFAADLFRMYSRYAENKHWRVDVIGSNESSIGGFKEVIFEVKGRGAFSRFKYERGTHRVQRIPVTESSGRIHTSTATVAVLPEADEIEVDINPDDLKIDFFHSRGAGGQNVNKVATAVRLTHLPTGIISTCQDERSQLRNRTKAMAVLRARLLDIELRKQEQEMSAQRRSQVGTGDRAEKIRTYNYPRDRITDHRIDLTLHNLPRIMDGELDELIDTLATSEQAKQLEAQLV